MSEIKISLPGSETVTLTGQTIDKLIRAGDGDAALLYLYILKTHGQSTESEAAIALDKSKGWIASAMAVLSRLRLVQLDTDDGAVGAGAGMVSGAGGAGTGAGGASAGASGAGTAIGGEQPYKEPRQYTENEVKSELMSGSDFSVVIDETQRKLGKILSPEELLRLFGIYDNLRLPLEVILQLITHCVSESRISGDGRSPTVRFIEKIAYTWEREGIFTLEKAEEYLKALEARKDIRNEIKKVLQIRNREFVKTEKHYVDKWIEMGIEPEAIAIAYEITVVKTKELTWPYIDTVIKNWHNKGLHTAEQVLEKGGVQKKNPTAFNSKTGTQRYGEPNIEEMERMRRLLNKIKED
ncbi:MAG: DnaD domain protein [Oscillospiraceae bacterium]|jgi:DnaD/phage-associated family protein|nr:DnaD domain protein [Oscillospiraceae bacterium]